MAGHFLLSPLSRDLTLKTVWEMTDEAIHDLFARERWGTDGTQTCQKCGLVGRHYFLKARQQWRCRDISCGHMFSVTSGTALHDHKLPLRKILAAMVVYVSNVKGISACALGRQIEVAYMSAFVLLHKLREMITLDGETEPGPPMSGTVQMDGAHVSGRIRKPRVKKPATKTQARDKYPASAFPTHPNRRIVMVTREVSPLKRKGAIRTAVDIVMGETEDAIKDIAKRRIKPGSVVMTDELGGYNHLGARYDHRSVNHSREFSTDEGVNNNQAESYFSRVRRFIIGQVHRVTPTYMLEYMHEMAWREDMRRTPPSKQISALMGLLNRYESKKWYRAWQERRRDKPKPPDGPAVDEDGVIDM